MSGCDHNKCLRDGCQTCCYCEEPLREKTLTPDQIKEAREIIADYRYGNAYDFRPLVAQALDEVERLQDENWKLVEEAHRLENMSAEITELRADVERLQTAHDYSANENQKLRAVAEAAEKMLAEDFGVSDLEIALKAWRGGAYLCA